MENWKIIAATVIAGLFVGLMAYTAEFNGQEDEEEDLFCKNIEDQVRQEKSFNGTISCFSADRASLNLSEEVQNRTEARCFCVHSYRGMNRTFAITVPK